MSRPAAFQRSTHAFGSMRVTSLTPISLSSGARVKPSREELIALLYREFGAFLAHSPHNPERFWGQPADAVLALLPGKTEQEVRADMLDALIDRYLHGSRASHAMPDHVISWIRSQPEYKARYVGAVSG